MTKQGSTRIGRSGLVLITGAFCLSPLFGQVDATALAAKYGPPVEEVFSLRSGIALAVTYGENRQVCKLDIRPTRNVSSVILASLVQQLVDELVPPSTRGTPNREFASISGAFSAWRWAEYDGMTVGQAGGDVTPNPEAQTQNPLAVIQFKSCQVPKR
jgi:hypothetical protein